MIEKICEELDIKPEELVIENIIKENQQLKEQLEEKDKEIEDLKRYLYKLGIREGK